MSKGPRVTRDFGLARLISADSENKNSSANTPARSYKIPKLDSDFGSDRDEIDEFSASISADLMFARGKIPIFVRNIFSRKRALKPVSMELINSFLKEKYPPLQLMLACSFQGTISLLLLNTESCEVLDSISS